MIQTFVDLGIPYVTLNESHSARVGIIPTVIDQNPFAQSRNPMDMMRQG